MDCTSIIALTFSLAAVLWTLFDCARRVFGKMDRIVAQMKETDNRIVMELHLLRAQLQNSPPEMLLKNYLPLLGDEPKAEMPKKKRMQRRFSKARSELAKQRSRANGRFQKSESSQEDSVLISVND